jgi:hypothetical protein
LTGSCLVETATTAEVVIVKKVNDRIQAQVQIVLEEFGLVSVLAKESITKASPKVRATILRVLADQGIISEDTPGIASVASEKYRPQILYALVFCGLNRSSEESG